MNCFDSYCRQIIRPPRRQYLLSDLGPRKRLLQSKMLVRVDFAFESRSLKLSASYFVRDSNNHRCMIYLHGNASCRLEGLHYAEILASWDINLCVLDFASCGMSMGEYITMGVYESQDVKELMHYIETNFGKVDEFILWGRSMGAVTALLLSECEKVSTYIIDSAFAEFRTLLWEIGQRQFGVFSFFLYLAIPILRKKIMNQAQFDIYQLNPIEKVRLKLPNKKFFFVAGKFDTLMSYQYTLKLYEQCQMTKKLDICDGDHNSNRPHTTLQRIIEFINESINFPNNEDYQEKIKQHFGKSESQQLLS